MSMALLNDLGSSRPSSGNVFPPQKSRSRTQSISSDRPSTIGHGLMSPPLSVSPEAAFIAGSAASQIVTNDHDSHADAWYDEHGMEPPSETVLVSGGALSLVNSFLDQLLFNFLSIAQSTSLAALRPAVSEVLKPKLAKDAVNQADEELREYLGGGDDEDYRGPQSPMSPRDWDLELVWKRTRLRCMVYSSLGDMEEEDEDYHTERENLGVGDENETVSPAVAIFLTSILEFMAEQTLVVAGQAAYHRMRTKYEKAMKDGSSSPSAEFFSRTVVEELDMERVALDRTLGRLWRAWKKRIRSPTIGQSFDHGSFSRPFSRDSRMLASHLRQGSLDVIDPVSQRAREDDIGTESPRGMRTPPAEKHVANTEIQEVKEEETEETPVEEDVLAASVPLPEGPEDMVEILIPGLAHYDDEDDEEVMKPAAEPTFPTRPKSMMIIPFSTNGVDLPTPITSAPQTPLLPPARKRANSLPTPATSPYHSPPAKRAKVQDSDDLASEDHPHAEISTEEVIPQEPLTQDAPVTRRAAEVADTHAHDSHDESEGIDLRRRRKSSAQIAALIAGALPPFHLAPNQKDADASSMMEEPEEEIEEFSEEPEILTSSRVSVSGRSKSPPTSLERRKPAISVGIPTRSASVHSLRVIEVTSPRSPMGSRNSSADALERASLRSSNLSRTDSVSTPPIVEEGGHRQISPSSMSPSGISPSRKAFPINRPTPLYQSDSIYEAEEAAGIGLASDGSTATPTTANVSTPSDEPKSATRYDELESQLQSSRAIFGSVQRHTSPPQSPARPSPTTKVTILSSSKSNGTFYFDEKPEVPNKSPVKKQRSAPTPAPPPVLPERSASRQVGGASTPSPVQQPVHASSIGIVSVERPSPPRRTPVEPIWEQQQQQQQQRQTPPRPSQDQASIRKVHHDSASSVASSQVKVKSIRSSQESSSRPEDVARNFEELIQSDQTIQYTLTPESMRDVDSIRGVTRNDSPVLRPKSRKSEDVQYQFTDRNRSGSTATTRPQEIKRSTSVSRSTGLSSHPVPNNGGIQINSAKLMGPVPRAPAGMSGKRSGSGPQARDARVPRESLADFAQFIRATGPSGAEADTSPINSSSNNGGGRVGGGSAFARAQQNAVAPVAAAAASKYSVESGTGSGSGGRVSTSSSSANRTRLTARDAAVDPREDNSDLIDFIRRGPPNGGGAAAGSSGNPRIPRTVAPFRTTMDSDQFAGAVGGKAVDATIPDIRHSGASTSITTTENSAHSSVHSSSALLRGGRDKPLPAGQQRPVPSGAGGYGGISSSHGAHGAGVGFGGGRGGSAFDDDMAMMMPKRKTRRVRDPYAIDLSDEEEDYDNDGNGMLEDIDETPRAARRQYPQQQQQRQRRQEPKEESLAEFLRNVPPPPEPMPVMLQQQQRPAPKKKASAPSLISRLTGGGRNKDSSGGSPTFAGFSSSGNSRSKEASPAAGARGHIPIQVAMPDGYGGSGQRPATSATQSPLTRSVTANMTVSSSGGGGRVRMKKFEPRDAVPIPSRGATSDLAEFLRSSEPPFGGPGPMAAGPGMMGGGMGDDRSRRGGGGGGGGGMFARRKPSGVM